MQNATVNGDGTKPNLCILGHKFICGLSPCIKLPETLPSAKPASLQLQWRHPICTAIVVVPKEQIIATTVRMAQWRAAFV